MSSTARPDRLLLQWHLSDRCNLRCAHCYQGSFAEGPTGLAVWLRILDQYRDFLAGGSGGARIFGHINVTGGEPFALHDFPALLDIFEAQRHEYSFAILSNGTLIDRGGAKRLSHWQPRYVQISIDGVRETHEALRGGGSFDKAVAGISALVAEGVTTVIAFTAHRGNWREFPEIARLGQQLGVTRVWADRLIPEGNGSTLQTMSPDETREFFALMRQSVLAAKPLLGMPRTEIAMRRALQFLASGADGSPAYRCTAGETLLTVMPDGTVYPCRRLPIKVGNIFETSLAEIYDQPLLADLRNPHRVFAGCEGCLYSPVCRGGLRCLSCAASGDWRNADPGCWVANTS